MARRTTSQVQRMPFPEYRARLRGRGAPARQLAVRHKKTLAAKLLAICRRQDARDPQPSRATGSAYYGAQATAGYVGEATQLELVQAAEFLIDRQCTKPARPDTSPLAIDQSYFG